MREDILREVLTVEQACKGRSGHGRAIDGGRG